MRTSKTNKGDFMWNTYGVSGKVDLTHIPRLKPKFEILPPSKEKQI